MSHVYFQCQGTGLLFPSDFRKNWGKNGYGSGLGKVPVSECLETDWNSKVAKPANLQSTDQIMFPVACPRYPLQRVELKEAAKPDQMAVLMRDDVKMNKRAQIIRNKQLENKNGLLKASLK